MLTLVNPILTERQVSTGGVVDRRSESGIEVALIAVGQRPRWQLPKGLIPPEEAPETAGLREVREETGLEAKLVAALDTMEYWYMTTRRQQRIRYHKFVHFYLMAYQAGDVRNHDHEVEEARWVGIEAAVTMLAFKGERSVVQQAQALIEATASRSDLNAPVFPSDP